MRERLDASELELEAGGHPIIVTPSRHVSNSQPIMQPLLSHRQASNHGSASCHIGDSHPITSALPATSATVRQ